MWLLLPLSILNIYLSGIYMIVAKVKYACDHGMIPERAAK
ncbi:hypothetical protein BN136_3554 [Cronobacter universalis NCTC 9529]|nr:hypothetical protein BN136_3554 [Cronobacter universalis NCTC 9529]